MSLLVIGTDGAVACAIMHVLFRDGYADRDYMARYTAGAAELDAASPPLPPHAARRRPAAARPAKAPNVRLDMCVLSQQGDPAGVG